MSYYVKTRLMKLIKTFKFKAIKDNRGKLTPINFDKIIKHKIHRAFFINLKKNTERGKHAHKKGYQIFICLKGTINFKIINKFKSFNLKLLESSLHGYIVPSRHWVSFSSKNNNSQLIVLCTTKFDKSDYIHDIKKL